MGFDFKKNEKLNKVIAVILVGMLILIVVVPIKDNTSVINEQGNIDDNSYTYEAYAEYYETRLKAILEESYGTGNIKVMVHLAVDKGSDNLYGDSDNRMMVDGVLVVANVNNEQALSDITFAVCALFDLPAHKVAVMIKK